MRGNVGIREPQTSFGEYDSKKVVGSQPTKNTETATVVKTLRWNLTLQILIDLLGFARNVFFYPLKKSIKIRRYQNKLFVFYRYNHECYGYLVLLCTKNSISIIKKSNV